jgi:hypothetical protein
MCTTDREVDVSGIDNHQMNNLGIVTAGGVVATQRGEVLLVMHQYAHVPQGRTIHSSIQLESFGNKVDDRSVKLKQGSQTITTLDGYVIPLNFINGLPYMPIRPYTDSEREKLPHVILTSDVEWDPSIADHTLTDDETWFDAVSDQPDNGYKFQPFDERGNYRNHETVVTRTTRTIIETNWHNTHQDIIADEIDPTFAANERLQKPSKRNFADYTDFFLKSSADTIKRTFEATTQYARSGWITGHIYETHKSPFPALNVRRRNEPVATNTIYADTPAIDDGSMAAQFYVGIDTKFCSAYGVKTDRDFSKTLMDVIRKHGAMGKLISDRAQAEISKKVQDILRHLFTEDWQSEPLYQHQNAAERRYNLVKFNVNRVLNMSGAPAYCWLLCLMYVIFIMNRMALESLDWHTAFQRLKGCIPDISMIYRFRFYDHIYYSRDESRGGKQFPSESDELPGRFIGFSEDSGRQMTYLVLTDDAKKVIPRSHIKLASLDPNLRLENDNEDDEEESEDDLDGHRNTGKSNDPDVQPTEHRPGGITTVIESVETVHPNEDDNNNNNNNDEERKGKEYDCP